MWDIKQKATNEQQTNSWTQAAVWWLSERGQGEDEGEKGVQIYGNRRRVTLVGEHTMQ